MRLRTALWFLLAFLLCCCGSEGGVRENRGTEPRRGRVEISPSHSFRADEIATNNVYYSSAYYGGKYYYLERRADKYLIHVKDVDGDTLENIELPRGKGPGEVMHNLGIRIYDGRIYFCDLLMRRMNIYDLHGTYVDEIALTAETGNPWSFEVTGDAVYFAGTSDVLLSKLDRATGKVKTIPMEEKGVNGILNGGTLTVNKETGDVFLGYYAQPYRIEKYDADLNHVMTISRKGMQKTEDPRYFRNARTDGVTGSFIVASLRNDGKYLYSAAPNGQEYGREWRYLKYDFFIDVYDMETGAYVRQLRMERPLRVQGHTVIADVSDGKLCSLIVDHGAATKALYPEECGEYSATVLVFELRPFLI